MVHEPPDDDYLLDDEDQPDDKELNQLIDEWLSQSRPERYDSGEKGWMDEAVKKAAEKLQLRPDREQVIQDAARRRVYQREGQATKRANKVLRDIADTGQMPFGWAEGDDWRSFLSDILSLPLSIARQRVRFGACTGPDLEQWELENAREEDKRRLAQIGAREGARLLASWINAQGVSRVEDLRASRLSGESEPPADRGDANP